MKTLPLLAAALALASAAALPAQEPGDSVRVWNDNGNMVGRLIRLNSLAVTFREFTAEQTIPRAEIRRIDIWRPRNQAIEITVDAVIFGLLAADWKQDPLVGAAAGALVGVASVSLWPGRWRRVRHW